MKAFRNFSGSVVEIDVDVDLNGQPILPPDTTTEPKPEAQPGHYVTVVGNTWVQISIPQEVTDFGYKKQQALEKLGEYKSWYFEQPTEVNGVMFDADSEARARLTQTLIIYNEMGSLPPAWIAADNTPVALSAVADLKAIVSGVHAAFSTRFFEMDAIRQQILNASDEAALSAVVVPSVPRQF